MTVTIVVFGSSLSLRVDQMYLCNIPYNLRNKISDSIAYRPVLQSPPQNLSFFLLLK